MMRCRGSTIHALMRCRGALAWLELLELSCTDALAWLDRPELSGTDALLWLDLSCTDDALP
jgi:hypothetical protein